MEALEDPATISGTVASSANIARHGIRPKRAVVGSLALATAAALRPRLYPRMSPLTEAPA